MSETLQTSGRKVQSPTENEWFEVKHKSIDRKLFEEERKNLKQERTRKLIIEAFVRVDENPEKYGKDFKTLMPKKDWDGYQTVGKLKAMAYKLGDHITDWVEQALEWAQRIANGESWEDVCNKPDTAKWFRLVVWKNGYIRLIGGSCNCKFNVPASDVGSDNCGLATSISCSVPSVTSYEVA